MHTSDMELNEILVASSSNVCNVSQDFNMKNVQIVDEGPSMSQEINPNNYTGFEEVPCEMNMSNLQILEEGPQMCPLCSQDVRSFFINFDDKIVMCENVHCNYPFSSEPLKIFREVDGLQSVEVKSLGSKKAPSTAFSQASDSAWSDIEKLCNTSAPCSPLPDMDRKRTPTEQKMSNARERREELLRNVEKIKELTKSMHRMDQETKGVIKNKKWLKNLHYLQGLSGVNLVRPEELKKIQKKVSALGSGELKIDIDKNNLSNIKIQVNTVVKPQ